MQSTATPVAIMKYQNKSARVQNISREGDSDDDDADYHHAQSISSDNDH